MRLHDGSRVVLRKLVTSYDPTDRSAAYAFIEQKLKQNEYVTGLIHIDETGSTEFHTLNKSSTVPLNRIPYEKLSPGQRRTRKADGALSLIAAASTPSSPPPRQFPDLRNAI